MRERKIRGDGKRGVKRKEKKRREREKMEWKERMKLKIICLFFSFCFSCPNDFGISFLLFPYSNIYILYAINALTYS